MHSFLGINNAIHVSPRLSLLCPHIPTYYSACWLFFLNIFLLPLPCLLTLIPFSLYQWLNSCFSDPIMLILAPFCCCPMPEGRTSWLRWLQSICIVFVSSPYRSTWGKQHPAPSLPHMPPPPFSTMSSFQFA